MLSNFNGISVAFNPLSLIILYLIYRVFVKITDLDKAILALSKDVEVIKNSLSPTRTHKVHQLPVGKQIPPPL